MPPWNVGADVEHVPVVPNQTPSHDISKGISKWTCSSPIWILINSVPFISPLYIFCHAPSSLFGSSLNWFICRPFRTSSPSFVRSGFPTGVVAPVKNLGCHSTFLALRSAAFSRCRSSSSCLSCVARLYCLLRIASVTPDQNLRDSLGSWSSTGGTNLATGNSGLRSMRRIFSWEVIGN
jgi:hypothetical protein